MTDTNPTNDDKNKSTNTTVVDTVAGAVQEEVNKEVQKNKNEATDMWNKTKKTITDTYDSLAFWKKELTEEEKMAKAKKKYAKAEKKYQKALAKAEKEQDEAKRQEKIEKANAKRTKAVNDLAEKYPSQVAQIQADPQLISEEMAKESAWQKTWGKTKDTVSNAYDKVAFWKKEKTPEARRASVDKKLNKLADDYEKALAKAQAEPDDVKRQKKIEKAENKYKKDLAKLTKKYPDEMAAVKQDITNAEAEAEAMKQLEAEQKNQKDKGLQKAQVEMDNMKNEDEKTRAKNLTGKELASQANSNNVSTPENNETQDHFEQRVTKNTAKKAKARVTKAPNKDKMGTLEKWMDEAKLPKETAKKMVDKYGLDMAYKLTQSCMLEPNNFMPKYDEQFKKIDNKSAASIKHFLDLDTSKAENKDKVTKATGLEFPKKETASRVGTGTSKGNRFLTEQMRQSKQQDMV